MADKPSGNIPTWATDATYSSGDDVGLDTRLEPTSGEKQQGYHRGKRPPARKLNWIIGKVCDWIGYLDEYSDEQQDELDAHALTLGDHENRIAAREAISFNTCYATLSAAAISPGDRFAISSLVGGGSFYAISGGNSITTSDTGPYLVRVYLQYFHSSTSSHPAVGITVFDENSGPSIQFHVMHARPGSDAGAPATLVGEGIANGTRLGIALHADSVSGTLSTVNQTGACRVVIQRYTGQ